MQRHLPKALLDKKNTSDKYLWTAQTVSIRGSVYFILRQPTGIQLYRYNYVTDQYDELDSLVEKKAALKEDRLFSDHDGWDHSSYYTTIQLLNVNDDLYVMGRGARGLWLSKYDFQINKWETPWITVLFSNAEGWNSSSVYYRSIRAQVYKGQLYVVARGMHGLITRLVDPVNQKIERLDSSETVFGEGWQYERYYLTIKLLLVNNELYLIGKKSGGVFYRQFDEAARRWGPERQLDLFTNESGWKDSSFHTTIRYLQAKNALYICGRNAAGLVLYKVNLVNNTYELLPSPAGLFSDQSGWSLEKHFYQFEALMIGGVVHVMFASKNTLVARYDERKKGWEAASVMLPDVGGMPMTDYCLKYVWNADHQVYAGWLALLDFSSISSDITPAFQSKSSGTVLTSNIVNDKKALLHWMSSRKGMKESRLFSVISMRVSLDKAEFASAIEQANKMLFSDLRDPFALEVKKFAMVEMARDMQKRELFAKVFVLRGRNELGEVVDLLRKVLAIDSNYYPAKMLLREVIQEKVVDAKEEIHKALAATDLSLVVHIRNWLVYQSINAALPFDAQGNTLLHWAAQAKNPHLIAWLMAKGASLTVKNQLGYTVSDALRGSGELELKVFAESEVAGLVSHVDVLASRIKENPRKVENYLIRGVFYKLLVEHGRSPLEKEVYLQQAKFDFERAFRMMPTLIEASETVSVLDEQLQVIKQNKRLTEQKEQVSHQTVLMEVGDAQVAKQLADIRAQWDAKSPSAILALYAALFDAHRDLADVFKGRASFYLYQVEKVISLTQKKIICQHANNDLKQAILLNPFDNELVAMMQKIAKMLSPSEKPAETKMQLDGAQKPGLFVKK